MKRLRAEGAVIALCILWLLGIPWVAAGAPGDELWSETYYLATSSEKVEKTLATMDHQGNIIAAQTSKISDHTYRFYVVSFTRDHAKRWEKTFDGKSYVRPVVDSSNNVIVAYLPNSQKYWVVVSISPGGTQNWTKAISLGNINDNCYYNSLCEILTSYTPLSDMVVDHHDNVIVVGLSVDSQGDYAGRVVSISPSGTQNWSRTFKKEENTSKVSGYAARVAVDSHDNVLVVGGLYNGRNYDIYAVSYSRTGLLNWTYSYAGEAGGDDWAGDVAADHNDNAVITGTTYQDTSSRQAFYYNRILSISPSGTLNWKTHYYEEGTHYQLPWKVLVDENNDLRILATILDVGLCEEDRVLGFSSSGNYQWTVKLRSEEYVEPERNDILYSFQDMALDRNNNLFVVGYWASREGSGSDLHLFCLDSSTGYRRWTKGFDYGTDDYGNQLAVNPNTGEMAAVGTMTNGLMALLLYLEGYQQPTIPEKVLKQGGEVRTISTSLSSPDASSGRYLGFGEAATGGSRFKVEAEFPRYLDQQDGSEVKVKIFVAAQLPDDYSRLAYFDTYNELHYQPPQALSHWVTGVTGGIRRTTISPEENTSASWIPQGTHYWYTLVVPDTVPDDFSGVNWATTPWEITVNVFEVK